MNGKKVYFCGRFHSGCGAVGSALRSGRRGRVFESHHPDQLIYDNQLNKSTRFQKFFVLHQKLF